MSEIVSTWQPKSPEITMTPRAVEHVQNQLQKRGKGIGMRFGIKKSGCSGFAYVVDLIDKAKDDDLVYQVAENLAVVVDPKHLPVLQGTEIDYIQEGINYRFQFNNPNETASCGCGESFTVNNET